MPDIDKYQIDNSCSFSIAPSWGCNVFSWIVDGKEIMFCPKDHPEAAFKITGGGIPTLFPSVGRTWDHSSGKPIMGYYKIYGSDKTYFMPPHGILFLCKWKKLEEIKKTDSASAVYEMVIPENVKTENYPFDLSFTHRYTLSHNGIQIEATIANKGSVPAPAAFGYHPYFKISNPERRGIEIRYPMSTHFMLTKDTVLLTGESEPTDGIIKLDAGVDYTLAYGNPTGSRLTLIDNIAGHAINVDFDKKCETFLAWSPAGADFICLEPWTRGLGGYEHIKNNGWEDGKYIPVLRPGDVTKFKTAFSVEKL